MGDVPISELARALQSALGPVYSLRVRYSQTHKEYRATAYNGVADMTGSGVKVGDALHRLYILAIGE